jgi:hypothetical protein
MTFRLTTQNVFEYLCKQGICIDEDLQGSTERISGKNFNLLITLPSSRKLFVKQERYDRQGNAAGEFQHEWQFYELLQRFPELKHIHPWVPEILHFDANYSVLVCSYLDSYRDLSDFYAKENVFPTELAATLGSVIATIHRATLDRQEYKDFLTQHSQDESIYRVSDYTRSLDRVEPEIFGTVPVDGIKFFVLYQRYESLRQAVAELGASSEPCCLTHNDLKLNNVLLYRDWEQSLSQNAPSSSNLVRVLDWERSAWGDPAADLGALIASYLQLWLNSLIITKNLSIEESVQLATVPLEKVQPSIAALTQAYLKNFPEILECRLNFLQTAIQFAGLTLIQQVQAEIQYQKTFGNMGIAMLQVAKSLLCTPKQSAPTVFGKAIAEFPSAIFLS